MASLKFAIQLLLCFGTVAGQKCGVQTLNRCELDYGNPSCSSNVMTFEFLGISSNCLCQLLANDNSVLTSMFETTYKNETLLHIATSVGRQDHVEVMVKSGVDLDLRDSHGFTALHTAVDNNREHIARFLLDHGINIEARDINDLTALHLSIEWRSLPLVRLLVEAGADVKARGLGVGFTPLHLASQNSAEEIARFLIVAGAEVDAVDKFGQTPLFWAETGGMVAELVRGGADTEARNGDGDTALHQALRFLNEETFQALIRAGADVNAPNGRGEPPIIILVKHVSVLTWLVGTLKDAGADLHARDAGTNNTALHLAVGDVLMLEALLWEGVDVGAANAKGETPLHLTALTRYDASYEAELLLQSGAEVDARNLQDQTPLHYAAANDADRVLYVLADAGADIDIQDHQGDTPLHLAAKNSAVDTTKDLIRLGAKTDVENLDGDTPCDVATEAVKGVFAEEGIPC